MALTHRRMLLMGLLMVACKVRGIIGSNADTIGTSSTTSVSVTQSTTDVTVGTTTTTQTGSSGTDGPSSTGDLLDVPAECAPPASISCDDQDDDPWHALGLDCPGGVDLDTTIVGSAEAVLVIDGPLGSSTVFRPREGDKMVALSTGRAADLLLTPVELEAQDPLGCASPLSCPSTAFADSTTLLKLPDPLEVRRVGLERDCGDDPSLVGTGDCSNSLEEQWVQGAGAVDYVEMRMVATVPEATDGLRYDFALMSSEFPSYVEHQSPYNDMYVAWLESEAWTGNISFDELGNPITATSVFLDYRAGLDPSTCADVPEVPELAGFAMQCHGATKWLSTTAPVRPGEEITLVFALFDLTDGAFDTVILLDNFDWTCSGVPPVTTPVG